MSESEGRERLWLKRSENGGVKDVVTESERDRREESPELPAEKKPKNEKRTRSKDGGVKWEGRPSLPAFYPFYLVGALTLACAVFWGLRFSAPLWIVGVLAPFLVLMFALPLVLQLAWKFEVTEAEARSKFRLWVGKAKTAPLDRVTDVVSEQGVVARLFSFGTVRLDTAGTPFSGVRFWGVKRPFEVEGKVREVMHGGKNEQG